MVIMEQACPIEGGRVNLMRAKEAGRRQTGSSFPEIAFNYRLQEGWRHEGRYH